MEEQCAEVQQNLVQGKVEATFRTVKMHFNERKAKANAIRDGNGKILIEEADKARRWKEYLEHLYDGKEMNAKILEEEDEVDDDERGETILRSEFDAAVKDLRGNKAPGIDEIPSELIKKIEK